MDKDEQFSDVLTESESEEPDVLTVPAQKAPVFKVGVDSRISISPVFDLFKAACKKKRFYAAEVTSDSVTAVFTRANRSILECFLPREPHQTSVAKLQVAAYPRSHLRLIVVKALTGESAPVLGLIQEFKRSFEPWVLGELKKHKKEKSVEQTVTIRRVVLLPYADFTKLLTEGETEVSRIYLRACRHWEESMQDASSHVAQEPLLHIKVLVNQVLAGIFSYHDTDSPKVYHHYKPLADKLVFAKYAPSLLLYYSRQVTTTEDRLQAQLRRLRSLSTASVLELTGVPTAFRLEQRTTPYARAIACLNNMQHLLTPLEKLNCLLEMVTAMRTLVLEYWKGAHELAADQAQQAVLTYIVTQVKDPAFVSQLVLLRDYVQGTEGLVNETRLLEALHCAVQTINALE